MLDATLHFILRQRLLLILSAAILLAAGIAAWVYLPIDAFPDVTNVQVMIFAEAPGWTPEEIERLVTFPIETRMGGLPGVRQVRSLSQSGLSQVTVIFQDNVDTYFARQLVFQQLAEARDQLPEGVEPELGPISTGLGEIYQYSVEAGFYCPEHKDHWSRSEGLCPQCSKPLTRSDADLMELRTIQDWLIAPQLRRLAGINEVNSLGGFVKQFHVICDPDNLVKFDVSLRDVMEALQANNANAGAGFILKDWEQINVISKGLLTGTQNIENIVLKTDAGTPVYLKDVAEIKVAPQVRYGAAGIDGRGETVLGMAIMLKGENSKIVVDRVKAEIPRIQKTLPPGVKINPFYDRTDLIQACIRTVSNALIEGAILIIIILFLLLWDLRAAIAVALSLPLTAAASFLLMRGAGLTANLMSLGGLVIALGEIADASIIVVENIARHMNEKSAESRSRHQIAYHAVREVARPVIFSFSIIIIVFVPLFTLESMEGKMFRPLALTICLALLSCLIVSLTIVPVIASMITPRGRHDARENPIVRFFQTVHRPALMLAIKGRWITVAIAAALLVAGASMLSRVGTEFLPDLNEGAIAVNIVRLPTASLEGSVAQSRQIERRLLEAFPDEVRTVVSKTGRAEISEDPMGPEQTDLVITLHPRKQWTRARNRQQLVALMEKELKAFPGIRPAFSQPIALRVNELISGIKSDVAIKIFGDDIDTLLAAADRIAPILRGIPGAADVAIEQVSGFAEIDVRLDRPAMARHQINAETINELVQVAVGGKNATILYEGQRKRDVVVRLPADYRRDIADLQALLVPSPLGYSVPLGDLTDIRQVDAYAQINREDSQRRLLVECNVRGRDIGSFVAEAQAKLASIENDLPQGYRLVWGGQFENQQRAMHRLAIVVPVSLLLIFIMLMTALGSFKSAALVMVNLPFAVVGGIAAVYLLEITISVAAVIGFIAVLGVAVENALVLTSFCDELRKTGKPVRDAVLEVCRLRIRPLVMTTLTTLLGLLPMLYATGPGSEIQKPLVAVIFGGLITSLALVLLVLPVLYILVNENTKQAVPTPDS
ncbi:MAG TPA: CusA/CzcA family heavy metal efflux RND transporter [Anaerohalosphaeraceae bacterium]|jgi:cobalt-zinc-cadmium resistance protein CzcA|nr:CusA/CzcA family heavy metal efflux RND transporter [Anaerohalosphaeraceae bacterium]HRT49927.1 CusA/CzcA family heavy metal efflux RND transporter [Anaerohalosphaeraceae bacterium]HRT85775.1 CusA/CzcA family heavy metal efflux RND transporter [Anaerohalosphaeraceae bacterium]